jgi:hypothetical protein
VPFLPEFSPEEQDLIARMLARVSIGEWKDYPGMPEPEAHTLAGGRVVVNDLLLYWIHHGRVRVVPGIARFDGSTVALHGRHRARLRHGAMGDGVPGLAAVPRRGVGAAP